MNATIYPNLMKILANQTFNMTQGSYRLLLSTATAQDYNHGFLSNITSEITGIGYPDGGANLGLPTMVYDAGNSTLTLTHNDAIFSNITANFNSGILYKDGASNATKPLLVFLDLLAMNGSQPLTIANGNISISFGANGSLTLQGVAA